jgi:crotonobetainyl-CoA:carnitine CoA-transferase CaiB-like acyl-CoA transferase
MVLDHVRIVELGSHIAAPATAGMLSDWGAKVIKVEQRSGDPLRWQFPSVDPEIGSAPFEFDNRGKRSIVIDYQKPEGRAVLDALIGRADVLVTNRLPASLRRAGLDYETLHRSHPQLVYTSITGYGLRGPAADTGAFDIHAFWSRSGLDGQMWAGQAEHLNWRGGIGDHVAALAAALGTAVALLHAQRTGEGQLVESSLLRAGTYAGGLDLAEQLRRGATMPPLNGKGPDARPSSYYRTSDKRWVCIWAKDISEWRSVFKALSRSDLAEDPRFGSPEAIRVNGGQLTEALEPIFASLTGAEIASRLEAMKVTWAPVLNASEVVGDELAKAAGCFVDVADGQGGSFKAPAPPVRLADGDSSKGPPPRVGEHCDEILQELGYAPDRIESLQRDNVVGASRAGSPQDYLSPR